MKKLINIILVALPVVMLSLSPVQAEIVTRDVEGSNTGFESGVIAMDYEPETWMLTTNWHQWPPYNEMCPGGDGCTHCPVGCTATAAAQIMRYWSWPPGYDWLNMPDAITISSPQHQIDAVAELCRAAGAAVGSAATYTCNWTLIWPHDMENALKNNFKYNATLEVGEAQSTERWHQTLKDNLNQNRPVLYSYLVVDPPEDSHSVVVDGWKTVGSNVEWHMNYGRSGTGSDTWYSIDYWPFIGNVMIRDIRPVQSLGSSLSGTYSAPSFPYRYFDQDATGSSATFNGGQYLQFLPGVKLRCVSPTPGDFIRFEGTSSKNTRLFSIKGTQSAGIKIYNGAIELYPGGGLRFH